MTKESKDSENKEEREEQNNVIFYHGARDKTQFHNLQADGPDPDKEFDVTRNERLALDFADGHPERILRYIVPGKDAKEILAIERPYAGPGGMDGTVCRLHGSVIRKIQRFLDPKQRLQAY